MALTFRVISSNGIMNGRSFVTSVGRYNKTRVFESEFERVEAGKQDRFIHGQKFEEWRQRWHERETEAVTKFRMFQIDGPIKERKVLLMRKFPKLWDFEGWDHFMSMRREKKECKSQLYDDEQCASLGQELAATHFFCSRGAAVRLLGSDQWLRDDPTKEDSSVPPRYVEGLFVERIDCKDMVREGIRYEGLIHLDKLQALKWLSFQGNIHFNDWCMDRLCGLILPSLEYLDISHCPVSLNGFMALLKLNSLQNLKFLIISNKNNSQELDHACAGLEAHCPNLLIDIKYE